MEIKWIVAGLVEGRRHGESFKIALFLAKLGNLKTQG